MVFVAGTFNAVRVTVPFPTKLGHTPWAFVGLKGVRGECKVVLRYVDLIDNQVLMESPVVPLHSDNPLASHELAFEVPPLPLPHAGFFALELNVNGMLVGSRRIEVVGAK